MAAELRAGGLAVEPYHEHFALDDVPDATWLRFVGERNWVALTHNRRIRYEPDEIDVLMANGVRAFFIIGRGPHSEYAKVVLRCHRKILSLIRKHEGPYAARVYQHGDKGRDVGDP